MAHFLFNCNLHHYTDVACKKILVHLLNVKLRQLVGVICCRIQYNIPTKCKYCMPGGSDEIKYDLLNTEK